jgi:hypothetical protein
MTDQIIQILKSRRRKMKNEKPTPKELRGIAKTISEILEKNRIKFRNDYFEEKRNIERKTRLPQKRVPLRINAE